MLARLLTLPVDVYDSSVCLKIYKPRWMIPSQLMSDLADIPLRGLLSGGSVWIPADGTQLDALEALVIGMLDGGIAAGDRLRALLYPEEAAAAASGGSGPPAARRIGSLGSEAGRFLVRCGVEEAMFLAHGLRCLAVSTGPDSLSIQEGARPPAAAGDRPTSGDAAGPAPPSLRALTTDELFEELVRVFPRFRDRYLAYFHYRSKGWMIRSGVQFGCDFVLYQAHPSRIHSTFSVLVIPVEIRAAAAATTATNAANATEPSPTVVVGAKRARGAAEDAADAPPPAVAHPVSFDWCEIRAIARVCTQVSKRLLLTYVGVLPAEDVGEGLARGAYERSEAVRRAAEGAGRARVEALVDRAFVEELTVQRWNPARDRD